MNIISEQSGQARRNGKVLRNIQLTKEEMENLNRPINRKESTAVIKTSQ